MVRVLFIGDIMGRAGRRAARIGIDRLREEEDYDIVIANGENAAGGFGLTERVAGELFGMGIDVLTGGNHTFDKRELLPFLNQELREIRRLMVGDDYPDGLVWLNLGVETASGSLLAANGGRAKMGACDPGNWDEGCLEQVRRLSALGYFPMVSLVMGLPGETRLDIERTLRWLETLGDLRAAVFPVFHAPLEVNQPRFGIRDMTPAHWRLFRACYGLNFKWIPRLFWDNQTRGGVSLTWRLMVQMLGWGQEWWWKLLFIWRSGRLVA